MLNKMSITEKILEASAFLLIILTIIIKAALGVQDTGTLVILGFTGIMLFVIFVGINLIFSILICFLIIRTVK